MLVSFPCGALKKRLDRLLQLMLNKELHLGISASVTSDHLRKSRNMQFTNHQRSTSAERRAGQGAQRVLVKAFNKNE